MTDEANMIGKYRISKTKFSLFAAFVLVLGFGLIVCIQSLYRLLHLYRTW